VDQETSLELIARAQAGDGGALEQLLARYRPRLQRWASGRLPKYARAFTDTEDLVQDAMIGTFRNIKAFEQRGEWALQAYLRRAVTNRVRDELRRHNNQPVKAELPEDAVSRDASPLQAAIGEEAFERYEKALDMLSDIEREAVIARVELGCSYEEIATLTEKPTADAARMAVSRALEKLARAMGSTAA
jgi:RNA polymerase sigma-70 factor, ECF subfamily